MGKEEFARVLAKIKPGAESERSERLFINNVMRRLQREIPSAKIVLAGSFAKGTFLEGDKDVDIFVLFSHRVEKGAIEGIVRAAVESAFPGALFQISYAQHPYVRLFLEGRKIDVVPAYEAGHGRHFEPRTAVDRSQLHTEYVLSNMSAAQKDDVRLLKKLLKANGLYGAEIKVQGFSGYLCELLILKYGSFMGAIRAISNWKERTFICLDGNASEKDSLSKFPTPLVVIDPVDPERNVSAAVSQENYHALIVLARAFLESKRRLAFFEPRKFSEAQLRSFAKSRHLYCVAFRAPEVADDILWGQVRRYASSLLSFLQKEGFQVLGHAMERCNGSICIVLELLSSELPESRIVQGPPLQFADDCKKFLASHEDPFIMGGRLAARVKRKECRIEKMAASIRALSIPSLLSHARHAKLFKCSKAMSTCRRALERYASMRLIGR